MPTMETESKPSKLEEIKQYFHSKGITAKDVPAAFLVHEVISVAFAAATWVVRFEGTIQDGSNTDFSG